MSHFRFERHRLSLASKRRFIGAGTPFRETCDMPRDFFKTTERQRSSAQRTRKRRAAVGKPQPVAVDEALSAAVKAELKRIKVSGDKLSNTSDVLNAIFDGALDHLVDVRGLDRQQSWSALSSRLIKRRRYSQPPR